MEAPVQRERRRRRPNSEDEQNANENGVSIPLKQVKKEKSEDLKVESNKETNETQIPSNEEINKTEKLDKRELLLKIFTKRTVDQIFSDAQMRYFQRRENHVI